MKLEETRLRSEKLYEGRIFTLYHDEVALPGGGESTRDYVRHNGAVCIVPLTDDGMVVVERQFRYAVGQVMLELPAGKLDSAGEDPLEAAKRELREETGAEAAEWISLGWFYPAVAYSTEHIAMFAAKGLTFGSQQFDEDEFLIVERRPLEELAQSVLRGEIEDLKTQSGILRAYLMRQQGTL